MGSRTHRAFVKECPPPSVWGSPAKEAHFSPPRLGVSCSLGLGEGEMERRQIRPGAGQGSRGAQDREAPGQGKKACDALSM